MTVPGEAQYRLFISYSHDDEVLRRELDKHLAMLRREGVIRIWHDREIGAGEEWRGQIDDELETAHLILLLISASFIHSDYCFDIETNRALERHGRGEARVIPVIGRTCDWRTAPFAELQALPTNGKPVTRWEDRDEAWTEVAKGLRHAIGEIQGRPPTPPESNQGREPRYGDEEIRRLSLQLKELYRHRKDLTLAGSSTDEIEGEILDVRRLLRKGPQLRAGEFLGDGRYELLEPIGQGGFATVWRAWDTDVEEQVAVKVLHGHLSEDRSKRERFFRGARKMAELTHPHIVRVLEQEMLDDGWWFFVMEYAGGCNLEQAVLEGKLTFQQRLQVLLQVCDALLYTHARGIVHRDIKPSNILLDERGEANLTDFDLVQAQDTTGLTATQAMMGTVQFAAPEALTSAADTSPASDVYSLGSTVVFAVSGERLPAGYFRDPTKVIAKLDCGDELKRSLERATAFEVEDRSPSISELFWTLQAVAFDSDLTTGSSLDESCDGGVATRANLRNPLPVRRAPSTSVQTQGAQTPILLESEPSVYDRYYPVEDAKAGSLSPRRLALGSLSILVGLVIAVVSLRVILPIDMIDSALRDMIDGKFSKWTSASGGNESLYVSNISFIDGVSKTLLLSNQARLIDLAVQDGMQAAADIDANKIVNDPRHITPNNDASVNKLVDIFFNPNSSSEEKYWQAVAVLLNPYEVDILITGMVIDTGQTIQVRVIGVSNPDRTIKSKDCAFAHRDAVFQDVDGTLALTQTAHEEIKKAVEDILRDH